jgi:hypothetical protein
MSTEDEAEVFVAYRDTPKWQPCPSEEGEE